MASGQANYVVVHKVIGWTVADYFGSRPLDSPLPEDWSPEDLVPGQDGFVSDDYVASLLETLPGKTRRVMELRYLDGLDHDQIAEELELSQAAVETLLFYHPAVWWVSSQMRPARASATTASLTTSATMRAVMSSSGPVPVSRPAALSSA